MIYAFDGFIPVVHETAFVHPHAAVTGNVIIGPAIGTNTTGQEAEGPHCVSSGEGH